MSTDATIPQAPEPPADLPWKEEFEQQWLQTRLAHEAMMLDKIQQQNKRVMDLADAVRSGTVGQPAESASDGEDMGVSIGNKAYHYHYETAQQANATNTATQPASGLTSTIGKAAAVAALLGTGGVGTILGGMAIDYLTKPAAPVVVQPAADTDTNAGLRFKD